MIHASARSVAVIPLSVSFATFSFRSLPQFFFFFFFLSLRYLSIDLWHTHTQTAFLHAAISGVFYQAYAPSQEGGLFNVVVFTDSGKTAVDLELYDTPGDFYTNPGYRHGLLGVADVIIVMFDQLNRTSFENAEKLVR